MWQEYLNDQNKECLRKSKEDGLYTGDYIQSNIRQTPVGPRPDQAVVRCMRCNKLIADRRNTPFSSKGVHNVLTEEDELKMFPEMRKVKIMLEDGSNIKAMVCKNCVVSVISHESDERLMFTVVAGHSIFFSECQRDEDFIRKQIRELEKLKVRR